MQRLILRKYTRVLALSLTISALSLTAVVASASADPICDGFTPRAVPATCSYSNSSIGDSYQVIRKVFTADQGGEAWIEWGTTNAYGTESAHLAIAANSDGMVTPEIGGDYNTTYYYRVVLKLDDGSYWYGTENTITTATADSQPTPAVGPTAPVVTATATPQPPLCAIPNLRGRTLPGARTLLAAANCSTGHVTRAWSSQLRRGRVISVVAPAGSLAAGTKVALVLSLGAKPHSR